MRTFKSKFFAGMTALVVAFGLFFTVNAKEEVKEVEVIKTIEPPEDGWYILQYINPNIVDKDERNAPSNLAIGFRNPTAPSGACDQSNIQDIPCSVEMEFSQTSTLPATLEDAQGDSSIEVNSSLAWREAE